MTELLKTTLCVERIRKIEDETKNTDKEYLKLSLKSTDKAEKHSLEIPANLVNKEDFKPQTILDISIKKSQKTMDDFKREELDDGKNEKLDKEKK